MKKKRPYTKRSPHWTTTKVAQPDTKLEWQLTPPPVSVDGINQEFAKLAMRYQLAKRELLAFVEGL